ncbi:hypothetical protein J6590_054353 [Homalodisca vitripennis]|nr:hypothetical protein J6590_054353 [Homalodisca vitripennis]
MLNQQESLAEKLTRKLKEDPAVGVGKTISAGNNKLVFTIFICSVLLQPCSRRNEVQTVQLDDGSVALAGRGHSILGQCCFIGQTRRTSHVDGTHGDPIECQHNQTTSRQHEIHVASAERVRPLLSVAAAGNQLVGLVAVCAVGGNRYRRGAFTIPSSLYLLQLRVLAQGAVVGSLAGGIAYTMYQHFRSGSHAADVEKEQ